MISTEDNTKTPPAATGLFALLSNKLRVLGTGAPKIVQGSGVPIRLLPGIFATTLVALAMSVAPALAGTGHGFTGLTIGEGGTGAGQLEDPAGVAVSDATTGPNVGDVYVVDKGNNRIDEFESDGAFIRAWGWEVDGLPGFGTCTTITTCQAGTAGSGAGQLDFPYAIAVDNSGSASDPSKEDVYVANTADNVIEKFSATGTYEGQLTGRCEAAGESPPSCSGSTFIAFGPVYLGVAVDPSGNLWVYENTPTEEGVVAEFSGAGSFEQSFETHRGTSPGLAVDSSDNVYLVPGSGTVSKWDPATATEIAEFSENVRALAIDSATNSLFIDHESSIAEWSLVEPYEKPVEEFASKQLADGAGAGVAVDSATGAVYVADAAGDEVDVFPEGPTPSEAPLTEAASGETGSSAVLHGELDPGGATGALEYQFDYNTGASCTGGQSTPVPAVEVAEAKEATVQATATNLEPNAQYTYCLVALNPFGQVQSNEVSFETLKVPPTAKTEPATSVKSTEARLEGLVNANNQSTKCEFRYGGEASLATGTTTLPCEPETLEGFGEQSVGLTVSGLTQNTTYYFRVIAENAAHEKEEGAIEQFTTPIHPETPTKLSASPIAATEATLQGTLNPHAAGNPGTYEFLYKASSTQCEGGESSGGSALGDSEEAVKAEITGLIPNTAYTFCLRAHNEAGEESALSAPVTFTTPPLAPVIKSEASSDVSATEARLEAEINPGNSETAYHFEYGPAADSYDVSVPAPDAEIHAGLTSVSVSAVATGLTPSTTYHYRAVAANALPGVVDGPDQTFTTPASVGTGSPQNCPNEQLRTEQPFALELPDCRAYEQVSPLDKNDSDAVEEGEDSVVRASLSGEAITYNTYGAFAEPAGSQYESQYLSSREPNKWSTKNITPPYKAHQTTLYSAYRSLAFTPELSAGITETDVPLTSEASPEVEDLYVADLAGASYQLVSSNGGNSAHSAETPEVRGASSDLSHVLFEDEGRIYEWMDGRLSVVNMMEAAAGGGEEYEAEGSTFWRAMSDNGARVFMTSPGAFFYPNRQLYMRENPEQPQSPLSGEECTVPSDACTVEVSASQKTNGSDPHGPQSARYWGASVDGSRVFLTSCEKLTNEATAASPAASTEDTCRPGAPSVGNDLYEYDLEKPAGEQLTDLTVDTKNTDGAAVLGVVDISEDGSYVYFVAEGELAARAVSGQPNLYLDHDGAVTFIATLKPGGKAYGQNPGDSSDWSNGDPALNTVRETPDGTHLAFISSMSLTGYDNEQAATGECEGFEGEDGKCREVYEYDAGASSESLKCVSCDQSGARPVGPSSFGDEEGNASSQREDYTPRSFSEDGGRLFFQSRDALVPQDSDGLQDVYEYEDGHVYPISDVTGGYESSFLDASASGNDVFIATTDQLLPQDTDFRTDVYDARVGGGLPVSTSSPACDSADACKAPVSPQPAVFGAPASSTFSGAGNLAPVVVVKPAVKPRAKPKAKPKAKQCRRGFVKKHGKCAKKAKKKTSKSSRHSKKGRK